MEGEDSPLKGIRGRESGVPVFVHTNLGAGV